jgi:aldose 1-epimerase
MADHPSDLGGAPLVRLRADAVGEGPCFIEAVIAPARGMLLLQARVRLPRGREFDLLATPPLEEVAAKLGGPEDFNGNVSFSLGGAILLPYANRIRGRPVAGRREIETEVLGRTVRLPMNWGGKGPGAEQYAMHGLMLDAPFEGLEQDEAHVRGRLHAGDFGGHWLSATDVVVEYRLGGAALELTVEAANVGDEPLPMGIGWHPWFNLPSGDRAQARVRLPARARTAVNDYDEVLPTGEVLDVAGTLYDFSGGRALGDLYLDDCFVALRGDTAEIVDPAARFGLRLGAVAPPVTAFQVYAPPDRPVVVVEPQYNRADPFSPVWKGRDTGMAVLQPGERTTYAAWLELFTP